MARISHIAIFTDLANVGKLVDFYVDVFGLTVSRRSKSGSVFVTDGYIQVALLVMEARAASPEEAGIMGHRGKGIDHFGITIEADEEAQIHEKLAKHGVSLFLPPLGRPFVEDAFIDVDGNKVDLTKTGLRQLEGVGAGLPLTAE
jgi:extradiol dioxygenase family protein